MTRRAGASRCAIRLDAGSDAIRTATSNLLFHEIHELVVHLQVDDDVRIAREKVAERRHQMKEAEAHRRADAQPPARRRAQFPDGAIGAFEIGKDPRRAIEIGLPHFGQAQRPRCSVQETSAEFALEVGDLPADCGFVDPEPSSGLGK